MEEYIRKVHLLRDNIKAKNVVYNWHDPQTSYIEATLSRGDRRMGSVIENVWRAGGRLEAWSDYFSFDRWMKAFDDAGVDPTFYAHRLRDKVRSCPGIMLMSVCAEHICGTSASRRTSQSFRRTAASSARPAERQSS